MIPDNNKKRTRREQEEFEEGKKNPYGFRSKILGSASEIAAFEEGQKEGRALKEKTAPGEDQKDDLESKR